MGGSCGASSAVAAGLLEESGKAVKEAVIAIVRSPEGKKYFAGVDPMDIELKGSPNEEGWTQLWEYESKVKMIANPANDSMHPELVVAQVTAIPSVQEDDGILFRISVDFGEGGRMKSTNRVYDISEKPPCAVSYELLTKKEDAELRKLIERECQKIKQTLKPKIKSASLGGRDLKEKTAKMLPPLIKSIVSSKEGQRYLSGIDVNSVQIEDVETDPGSWAPLFEHFARKVIQIPNPGRNAEAAGSAGEGWIRDIYSQLDKPDGSEVPSYRPVGAGASVPGPIEKKEERLG